MHFPRRTPDVSCSRHARSKVHESEEWQVLRPRLRICCPRYECYISSLVASQKANAQDRWAESAGTRRALAGSQGIYIGITAEIIMLSHRYAMCIRNQSDSFVSADVEWLMDVTAMKFEGLPNVCLADRVGCHEDT